MVDEKFVLKLEVEQTFSLVLLISSANDLKIKLASLAGTWIRKKKYEIFFYNSE